MICAEDPFRRRPGKSTAQINTTGGVCLDDGKYGKMAFRTGAAPQKQAIGWLRKGCCSLGGGPVVRFPRIWMSSGECRLREQEIGSCRPMLKPNPQISRARHTYEPSPNVVTFSSPPPKCLSSSASSGKPWQNGDVTERGQNSSASGGGCFTDPLIFENGSMPRSGRTQSPHKETPDRGYGRAAVVCQ